MYIRSKAPFRIGFAGGGTDVSPYCDEFGGAILNTTISLYAHAHIKPRDDGKIVLHSLDTGQRLEFQKTPFIEPKGDLLLQKGIYNRIVKEFTKEAIGLELTTEMDVPTGSGLGTSSTLVVSILGAFTEWLNLPLGEYDMARMAFEIERLELGMAGGRQDQYAATFGGVNFMEFYEQDKVIINPLRIKEASLNELQNNLILFYTQTSRESGHIIENQSKNVSEKKISAVEAMHNVKQQAFQMKEALLTGRINEIGEILDFGWQNKKKMAKGISNPAIDELYSSAVEAGASGGKISGAGGGGFMILYCPFNNKFGVLQALKAFDGRPINYNFTTKGVRSWKSKGI